MSAHRSASRNFLPLIPTLLILVILIAATGLRTIHLTTWPPGLSRDESIDGIDAFMMAQTGSMPLYLRDGRPEPTHRLLAAFTVGLIGPSTFSLRLVSVTFGVLSVAAAYRAGRHLTSPPPNLRFASPLPDFREGGPARGRVSWRRLAGLAAAGVLAMMLGAIHLSRVSYRGMLLPFAALMWFDAFIVAWQTRRRRDFLIAGAWLGAAGLTYTSGLAALPVAILGMLVEGIRTLVPWKSPLPEVGEGAGEPKVRRGWGHWLRGTLWMFLAALIIYSPMLILLAVQPGLFFRAAEVSRNQSLLAQMPRLWRGVINTWQTMYKMGDINPQYNTAQAPLLYWKPFYWLLLSGIAACVLRWRRLASWLSLGLLGAMLLPVAAANEIPHGLRIVGEYAPVPLILAANVDLAAWLTSRIRSIRWQAWIKAGVGVAFSVLLVIAGMRSWSVMRDYFTSDVRWGDGVISAWTWFFETRAQTIAQEIAASNQVVYVPISELAHPPFRYFTLASHPNITTYAHYFGGNGPLDLPAGRFMIPVDKGDSATYAAFMPDGTVVLLPRFDEETLKRLQVQMLASDVILTDPYGEAAATSFDFPVDGSAIHIEQPIAHPVDINYGDQFRIVGWDAPLDLPQDGSPVRVTFYFARAAKTNWEANFTAQLWNPGMERLSSSEETMIYRWQFLPNQWRDDDIIPYEVALDVPEGLPPSVYYIAAGLRDYRLNTIPVLGADGAPASDLAIAGAVRVPKMGSGISDQMVSVSAEFGEQIELIGYWLSNASGTPIDSLIPDQPVTITLYWRALKQPSADYTAFVHVVDPAGNIAAQSDLKPDGGSYPTIIWAEGDIVSTTHIITLPADSKGPYTIYAGWYTFPDLQRLPVIQNGKRTADDRAVVAEDR